MNRKDSSLQPQNTISQAQESVDDVHAAVASAQSHPTAQTIAEAGNAVRQAEQALSQAAEASTNHEAIDLARSELEAEKSALEETQNRQ